MDNEAGTTVTDVVTDQGVPDAIAAAVGQAVEKTKMRLRNLQESPLTDFCWVASAVATQEATTSLQPVRTTLNASLNVWFETFFGPDLGPFGDQIEPVQELYNRWRNDPTQVNDFEAVADELFRHIIDAVCHQILAECRDANLI